MQEFRMTAMAVVENADCDNLSESVAGDVTVLARDSNVRSIVRRQHKQGLARGVAFPVIEQKAVESILWIYPIGRSRAVVLEAVRRLLAEEPQD